jgi:hypothetical protein
MLFIVPDDAAGIKSGRAFDNAFNATSVIL